MEPFKYTEKQPLEFTSGATTPTVNSKLFDMEAATTINQLADLKQEFDTQVPEDQAGFDSKYSCFVMFCSFMNLLVIFGAFNAFGLFQEYYLNTLFSHEPASKISWISTLSLTFTSFGGMLASPVISRIGIRPTLLIGSFISGIGLFLASFCTHSIVLLSLTQGLIYGLGGGMVINPSILMSTLWFSKYRDLSIGIVSSGSGFGGMVIGPIIQVTIKQLGIVWSLRVLSFITLAVTGTTSFFLKARDKNFKPNNKKLFDLALFVKPYTLFLCIGGFFTELSYIIVTLYFPATAVSIGMTRSSASSTIMAFSAASGISRLLSGIFSKKFGPNVTLIASLILCCALVFSLWMPSYKSFAVYYTFIVINGFLGALFYALVPVMVSNNYHVSQVSQVNAMIYLFYGFGSVVGIPVLGEMFDKIGHRTSYTSLIILCGICYAFASCFGIAQYNYSRKYMPALKHGKI
ncbi:Riboflavin transporter MCH5 [Smittium culicis]|uniref:Riboflavin transporter MCH5 n=2 Tax=Smittium culicis TaxID=133412 RepID=A0A1R1YQR9_9FUNG|nr:Riboflavin transporter MCH5 [Smittium culicis]